MMYLWEYCAERCDKNDKKKVLEFVNKVSLLSFLAAIAIGEVFKKLNYLPICFINFSFIIFI